MTAAEFDTLYPLLKISEERIRAARAAIVDGRTMQSIGDEFGWTKQAVDKAIRSVWELAGRYRESQRIAANLDETLPLGWERVTLIAPSYLIPSFKEAIARALFRPRASAKAATNSESKA
jgi:hypothetical protein